MEERLEKEPRCPCQECGGGDGLADEREAGVRANCTLCGEVEEQALTRYYLNLYCF